MKQVVQYLDTGSTELADIPSPSARRGTVLVRTSRSLVSPGTERMLRDFGKAGFIAKARSQPDKVRQVLDKVKADGLMPTVEAVRAKLEQPIPLGYCNVGRVLDAGSVEGLSPGDRVVSNGPHAEIVRVARNLVVRVPDSVDDDTAAFTVLGSIALEGIRLAEPTLGESVAVMGLGLVGLLAVQLLKAQGVRVVGIDLDPERCALARAAGAQTICIGDGDDPVERALAFSRGRGVDAVLICAATKSNDPIVQSAQMCRTKGRVVLIGVVGLEVPRDEFFRKELSFQVSCSYGPGRYDAAYEEGQDYPFGYVRWTAQRNFEAVLDLMAAGSIDVRSYINRRVPITQAADAYSALDTGGDILGILFDYPAEETPSSATVVVASPPPPSRGKRLAVIGAGNYATRMLLPAFVKAGAAPVAVAGSGSAAEVHAAKKFGFARASSDADEVIASGDIDLAVVATRHDTHASFVVKALQADKAVFVEKPLALTDGQLDAVEAAYRAAKSPFLMVGFNRRFSPFLTPIARQLRQMDAPPAITLIMNAGALPLNHWHYDPEKGGGRIISEACHFVDLARFLAGAPIVSADAKVLKPGSGPRDSAILSLAFGNGAVASVHYFSNGHRSMPKEQVQVFCGGKSWRLDNFRKLEGFGAPGMKGGLLGGQDKGQDAMAKSVVEAVNAGTPAPIPAEELFEVARVTIALDSQLRDA
jgi:predicted dehydrogenase